MKKRLLSVIFVTAMVLSVSVISAAAYGGEYNHGTWTLDDDGTLTLSGAIRIEGADFNPWDSYSEKVKNVIIEGKTYSIEVSAFSGYSNMISISFPDSLADIRDEAFYGCTSLKSITIPKNAILHKDVFGECSALESISVAEGSKYYCAEDNVLFNKDKTELIKYAAKKENTSYTVPDSVEIIDAWAFEEASALEDIKAGSNIKNVGTGAFNGTAWEKNNIGNSLVMLGSILIYYNSEDENIVVPDGITVIGGGAFPREVKSIVIPKGVVSISNDAFKRRQALESISLPDTLEMIGDDAFDYCSSLTSITIPNSVTSLGNNVFSRCTSLETINGGENITDVGYCAFDDTPWFENYPGDFIIIGKTLINYKGNDEDITIPNGITVIGSDVFEDYRLRNVIIPDSVTKIDEFAFYYCVNLTSITIPDSVTEFADTAIMSCDSLETVYYGGSIQQWNKMSVDDIDFCVKNAKKIFASAEITPKYDENIDISVSQQSDNVTLSIQDKREENAKNVRAYAAQYDENGRFSGFGTVTEAETENGKNIDIKVPSDDYKIMLWANGINPVISSVKGYNYQ